MVEIKTVRFPGEEGTNRLELGWKGQIRKLLKNTRPR